MKISKRDCLIFLIPTVIYAVILISGKKDEQIIKTVYPNKAVAVCAKLMAMDLFIEAEELGHYDLPIKNIERIANEYQPCFR